MRNRHLYPKTGFATLLVGESGRVAKPDMETSWIRHMEIVADQRPYEITSWSDSPSSLPCRSS